MSKGRGYKRKEFPYQDGDNWEWIEVTPQEIAYAAGFFDGEGAVMIWRRTGGKRADDGLPYHRLHVRIRQCDRRPLDWLAERFGGTVHRSVNAKTATNSREAFDLCMSARSAAWFLRTIRPYVIVKAERIDVALKFQVTMGTACGSKSVAGRNHALPPGIREQREAFRNELMRLNARGLRANPVPLALVK